MSDQALLSLDAISFERDDVPLFAGVSAQLHAGDILQVAGPNGVGKTTLIKILATILSPTTGELAWMASPLAAARYDYLSELLYIGHIPGISMNLTPRENLAWWLKLQGLVCEDMDAVFREIGLARVADRPCFTLSAGQARRVALARLLTGDCKFWLLDEPFTAIDREGARLLEDLFAAHAAAGGLVVFSSHQDIGISGIKRLELADYHQEVAH